MSGGGSSLPANPSPAFQYPGQGQAASGALGGAQSLPNYAAANYPQFQSAVGSVTSGAYGAPAIQGAGNTAISAGNSLVPYATQSLQTGFDPQNALYKQQQQQNTDQTRATEAAQGVAGTPYGAGVENSSNNNFNLQWQNNQLARQQQAAGTAEGLLAGQNAGATTGAGLLQSIPNEKLAALGALNSAGGAATGVNQQQIQDFLAYLQGGTSATSAGTGQYSAEANASLGQQGIDNQGLAGFGQLAGNLLPLLGLL